VQEGTEKIVIERPEENIRNEPNNSQEIPQACLVGKKGETALIKKRTTWSMNRRALARTRKVGSARTYRVSGRKSSWLFKRKLPFDGNGRKKRNDTACLNLGGLEKKKGTFLLGPQGAWESLGNGEKGKG